MRTPITKQTYLPKANNGERDEDTERAIAQVAETLTTVAADGSQDHLKLVLDGNPSASIELPTQLLLAFTQVARAMNEGLAVSIVPHETTISTQEAADILGVSRPTLIRMLDANKLPYQQVNRHRRLKLADVLDYQKTMKAEREKAMDEIVMLGEQLDLDDVPLEEILRVTREVRKGKASSKQP